MAFRMRSAWIGCALVAMTAGAGCGDILGGAVTFQDPAGSAGSPGTGGDGGSGTASGPPRVRLLNAVATDDRTVVCFRREGDAWISGAALFLRDGSVDVEAKSMTGFAELDGPGRWEFGVSPQVNCSGVNASTVVEMADGEFATIVVGGAPRVESFAVLKNALVEAFEAGSIGRVLVTADLGEPADLAVWIAGSITTQVDMIWRDSPTSAEDFQDIHNVAAPRFMSVGSGYITTTLGQFGNVLAYDLRTNRTSKAIGTYTVPASLGLAKGHAPVTFIAYGTSDPESVGMFACIEDYDLETGYVDCQEMPRWPSTLVARVTLRNTGDSGLNFCLKSLEKESFSSVLPAKGITVAGGEEVVVEVAADEYDLAILPDGDDCGLAQAPTDFTTPGEDWVPLGNAQGGPTAFQVVDYVLAASEPGTASVTEVGRTPIPRIAQDGTVVTPEGDTGGAAGAAGM